MRASNANPTTIIKNPERPRFADRDSKRCHNQRQKFRVIDSCALRSGIVPWRCGRLCGEFCCPRSQRCLAGPTSRPSPCRRIA
jgi:hypothetical protein